MSKTCLPINVGFTHIQELESYIRHIGPLKRGDHLFRTGDPMGGLLIVQSGCFKLYGIDSAGREYIPGFCVSGDAIGLHGFFSNVHEFNALALSTSMVCQINQAQLNEVVGKLPAFLPAILRTVGKLLVNNIFLSGSLSAEERVTAFLFHFQDKLRDTEDTEQIFLPMSRGDISINLRMALATVSRMLSRLEREGIIKTDYHHIQILDQDRLAQKCKNVPFIGKRPK
ncbi:MAG: cyclic nucleotide-binding domain-containing protein [Gammaproteobacteria bacterium]